MPTTTSIAWTAPLVNTPINDRTVAKTAVPERSLRQNRPAALLVNLGIMPTTSRMYAYPAPITHIRQPRELMLVFRVLKDRMLGWAKLNAILAAQVNISIQTKKNAPNAGEKCKKCPCNTWSQAKEKECHKCASGYGVNDDQTGCEECPPGTYGADGVCTECPDGQYQPNYGSTKCLVCEGCSKPNNDKTSCEYPTEDK
jgi:hypothetical protein